MISGSARSTAMWKIPAVRIFYPPSISLADYSRYGDHPWPRQTSLEPFFNRYFHSLICVPICHPYKVEELHGRRTSAILLEAAMHGNSTIYSRSSHSRHLMPKLQLTLG
ncbi:hypothetical protein Cni_G28486 [Canna indica]|uniref:Uncharacterized protein n=1 Tax=Canna indica TaxID=4628 RepID=A0AAQ3L333_9LILI|nr:hypothetical protein Cni_G28486 [Canna indica]